MATSGHPVADTTAGRIVGDRIGPISVFRGIPYAQAPVGELRFASPRPPEPWSGERDATLFAAPSLQDDAEESGEDCLYANVWTPDVHGRRPVLVYIHGGAWKVGSGSSGAYDGARFAERGDVVVVTFNYRLGVLGFGSHEQFEDSATGSFANWGMQDQAALLRWIRDNAAAFGGDPDQIVLGGTSAGGANSWLLTLLPEMRRIVSRLVSISACHVWAPATALTQDDARTVYQKLATDLGTSVTGLRDVPVAALTEGWDRIFAGPAGSRLVGSGREYRGPIVDGQWVAADGPAGPDLPTMVIHTDTEGSFYTGPFPTQPLEVVRPTTDAQLRDAIRVIMDKGMPDVGADLVGACIEHYRAAAAAQGRPTEPNWIWTEVWGDALFRHGIMRRSQRQVRDGRGPVYLMEFAQPVSPPSFGTPHESTSPFLFGTFTERERLHDTWRFPLDIEVFALGPVATTVSNTFIDLVASFVRGDAPASALAPAWPEMNPDAPTALVLGAHGEEGAVARVAPASKQRELGFWDEVGWGPDAVPPS
ncbi:MAG: carboxylesterase family protein [Kibdelosporangium sp.]